MQAPLHDPLLSGPGSRVGAECERWLSGCAVCLAQGVALSCLAGSGRRVGCLAGSVRRVGCLAGSWRRVALLVQSSFTSVITVRGVCSRSLNPGAAPWVLGRGFGPSRGTPKLPKKIKNSPDFINYFHKRAHFPFKKL